MKGMELRIEYKGSIELVKHSLAAHNMNDSNDRNFFTIQVKKYKDFYFLFMLSQLVSPELAVSIRKKIRIHFFD